MEARLVHFIDYVSTCKVQGSKVMLPRQTGDDELATGLASYI